LIFQIEKGESKIQKRQEFMNAVKRKVEKYANPWQQLKFQYGNAKVSNECVAHSCCMVFMPMCVCHMAAAQTMAWKG
jgi:hypothetical protein